MAYAILRTSKLKTWGNIGGSGAHTYRVPGMAPNADPARLGRNRTLRGTPGDVLSDVKGRVGQVTDKPRKNAVLCVEHLLTASPEWFKGKSQKELVQWARENLRWLDQRYGKANVAHVAMHLDESTPHLVAYVVPEVDGRLNARALFGGRAAMTGLQTSYADAMKPFGLRRGLEGSKAKHTTVKAFYAQAEQVERQARSALKKVKEIEPPPDKPLWQRQETRQEVLEEWQKGERQKVAKTVQTAAQAVLKARTREAEVKDLKKENAALSARVEQLEEDRARLADELMLSKDEVGRLRKLDISAVASRLGHYGEVGRKENAIDLVKRINAFDYKQAVAWLYHEFGETAAATAVQEDLYVKPPERPFTKAENTIKRALEQQTAALGCDQFRLSLIDVGGSGKPYLPGKHGDQEHFYTREELVNLVPYLRHENNHGRSIFITPMDDHAYYLLLDDLRISEQDLKARGYTPCLVQKTSWDSTQAVLKIPKEGVDRRAAIDLFNHLNQEIGDPKISGLRHPMRAAGFRNMKAKHQHEGKYPFVTLVEATNRFCRKAWEQVQALMRPAPDQEPDPPSRRPKSPPDPAGPRLGP